MGNMGLHTDIEKQSGRGIMQAGRKLLLFLKIKKPEPETIAAREGLVRKRNAAMSIKDYFTVAKCDMSLGMDNTKAWKKAGDRYSKCEGKEEDVASCYLRAGRSDLLIKQREHARKDENYEAVAIYDIAHGSDAAQAWKTAGGLYFAKRYYGRAARCYRKGGFEMEAKRAEAAAASQSDTGSGRAEGSADDWQTPDFIMHPHR